MYWPGSKLRGWLLALIGLAAVTTLVIFVFWQSVPNVAKLQEEAFRAMAAGDWESAETIASHWVERDATNGEPWMLLGRAALKQKKYQKALEYFASVPSSSPESESAAVSQMELLFGPLNSPVQGATACRLVLAINPQSQIARQRIIFFLAMTLQRPELAREIRVAIETQSEPLEAYVYLFLLDSLMFSNGIETNSRWLRDNPASELFEVAQAIFIAETLDFSISLDEAAAAKAAKRDAARRDEVMQRLMNRYPHNAELLAYKIRKAIEVGDSTAAVELLARSTVECESDGRFWRFKGWIHQQRGESADAQAAYRHAIELNPLDWVTRHMLAETLQQQKRFDEAAALRDITVRGRELRNAFQNAPSAREIPPRLLLELADYAASCGDEQVSRALKKRIPSDRGL